MRGDELPHHADALVVLHHLDADAARTEEIFLAHERAVLADDDVRDAVEEDGAGAHRAGRQRRVEDGGAIDRRRQPAGVLERIHLAVQDRAALLDPPVVAAPEDAPVVDEHRADRDAAFAAARGSFVDRGAQVGIGHACQGCRAA